jgi:hypothetical protein
MRRDFGHSILFFQRFDNHFLLNGRDIFLQVEVFENFAANGPETVLAVA